MLRVQHVHVLRHKVLVEGQSQRQVARELGISRNTVRRYRTLAGLSAWLQGEVDRRRPARGRSVTRPRVSGAPGAIRRKLMK